MDCLHLLAKTAPDDYFAAASSEELVIDRLWNKLKESRLITSEGNESYAAKLHQIFDLSVENGMTSLIFEVLEEVNSKELMQACNMTVLDCLLQWAQKTAAESRRFIESLSSGTTEGRTLESMMQNCVSNNEIAGEVLEQVLAMQKLEHPLHHRYQLLINQDEELGGTMSQVLLRDISQLKEEIYWSIEYLRMLLVVESSSENGLASTGKYKSVTEWAAVVQERRSLKAECAKDSNLLIDLLLQKKKKSVSYPQRSIISLISSFSFDKVDLETEMGILVYYMVDSEIASLNDLCDAMGKYFGISNKQTLIWSLAPKLDSLYHKEDSSWESMMLVMQQLYNTTSIPVHYLGQILPFNPSLALRILQRSVIDEKNVEDACTAIRVRLENEQVCEAYIIMKSFLKSAPKTMVETYSKRVIDEMFDWGTKSNRLYAILSLPVDCQMEEPCLITWLEEANRDTQSPHFLKALILYFVLRGRYGEAQYYYKKISKDSLDDLVGQQLGQIMELASQHALAMPQGMFSQSNLPRGSGESKSKVQGDTKAQDTQTQISGILFPMHGSNFVDSQTRESQNTSIDRARGSEMQAENMSWDKIETTAPAPRHRSKAEEVKFSEIAPESEENNLTKQNNSLVLRFPFSILLVVQTKIMQQGTPNQFRKIAVFCGSSIGKRDEYALKTVKLGKEMVKRDIGLVYGGGNVGLMGVIAETVFKGGKDVVGIIPDFLEDREISGTTLGEIRVVQNMHTRKAAMFDEADAFIAIPGGLGTLDETLEICTWQQLGLHAKPIGLLNIDGFFDGLLQFLDHATEEGFIRPASRAIILSDSDPAELIDKLLRYQAPPSVVALAREGKLPVDQRG